MSDVTRDDDPMKSRAAPPRSGLATAHRRRPVRDPGLAGAAGPLRSRQREGFLRRRLHRRHEEPQVATPSSSRASRSCRTSTIAARSAPTRRWATAAASSSRSRTASSPRNAPRSASRCRSPGDYGVGHLFMPRDPEGLQLVEEIVEKAIADEGLQLLGWRDVPVDYERSRREREGDRAGPPADLRRQGQGDRRTRRPSSGGCSSPAR